MLLVILGSPAAAQTVERGFVAVNGGAQAATGTFSDRFNYTVNVEQATTDVRYPSGAAVLFDGGAGFRFWKNIGAAVMISRSSTSGAAQTDSLIPHPFFDDRDRQVSGEATDLTRTETAAHVQIYYVRASGPWRMQFSAGPTYFNLEQEVVTGIQVREEFPYDTATFDRATTARGRGSAVGFNAAVDVGWMFTRRLGLGGMIRFARGEVDFNVNGGHRVSTETGGVQGGAGIRIRF